MQVYKHPPGIAPQDMPNTTKAGLLLIGLATDNTSDPATRMYSCAARDMKRGSGRCDRRIGNDNRCRHCMGEGTFKLNRRL